MATEVKPVGAVFCITLNSAAVDFLVYSLIAMYYWTKKLYLSANFEIIEPYWCFLNKTVSI